MFGDLKLVVRVVLSINVSWVMASTCWDVLLTVGVWMAFDQAAVKTCLSIGATSSKAFSECSCAKAEHGSLLFLSTRSFHLVLWIC